jgi:hypothetical protein
MRTTLSVGLSQTKKRLMSQNVSLREVQGTMTVLAIPGDQNAPVLDVSRK